MDYFLTFPDKEAFESVMGQPQDDGLYSTPDMAVDVIGVIYRNTGTDEEPVFIASAGYHVNVSSTTPVTPLLEPFLIPTPEQPKRVFA